MKWVYWLAILLSVLTPQGLAQSSEPFPQASLPGSQVRLIQSSIVNQEYKLSVKLPDSYGKEDKRYPVIYVLDSQWDFPLVYAIHGQQYYDGFIPEAIIVGIGWGGINPDPNVLRVRDFTPTHIPQGPNSGGAGKFLKFIQHELIPFISSEYQVSEQRVLMGSSYGGLFTLYALFKQPALFSGYIPTSSASDWDNGILYSYAQEFTRQSTQYSLRLYSAVGDLDNLTPDFDGLLAFFNKNEFKGLSIQTNKFAGIGHAGVKAEATARGLQYVFKKADIVLTNQQLKNWVGEYKQDSQQPAIKVWVENQKLLVNDIDGQIKILKAASPGDFYHPGELFNLTFSKQKGLTRLQIERFMASSEYTRTNTQN